MRRQISRKEPAKIHEIVNITARQMGLKVRGHSDIKFKGALEGKDWMHPRVQKVLNRYIDRHLFDNPLTTRERMKSFLDVASEIGFGRDVAQQRENLLRHHLLRFVTGLELKERHTLQNKFVITRVYLEHLKRKLDSVSELSKQDWSKIKVTTNEKKQVHEKDSSYYTLNARDATAHLYGIYTMQFSEVVDDLIRISKNIENSFGRFY